MKNLTTTAASTTVIISDADSVFKEIVNISNRTAKGVLEIGKLIFEFNAALVLNAPDQNDLEKKLITEKVMAASTISSYRTIGACAVLPNYLDALPPYFNHMYVLAAQEKKQPGFVRMKVESGELNRATTLSTIRSWVAPVKQDEAVEGSGKKIERNGRVMLRVYVDQDGMDKVIEQLNALESSTASVEVDYAEVDAFGAREREQEIKSARRSAYNFIKQFKAGKLAELQTRLKASIAKEDFKKYYAEIADFLEFNDLGSVVAGHTTDETLNTALKFIGGGVCMNDFYEDALAA